MSTEIKKPRKRGNATEAIGQQNSGPATAATMPVVEPANKPATRVFEFNGRPLTMLARNGQVWCIAKQAGEALGYTDGSKLSENITSDWSDEFLEGTDYVRVTGKALAQIKAVLSQPERGESNYPPKRGVVDPRARHLVLLSRSGLDLAATLARTKDGAAFRRWLVSTVLPAFRQEQVLTTATDEQIRTAVRAEMERQFRTPESKLAELNRLSTNVGTVLADRVGASQEQVRGWALELAKGVAGFGGAGRELGYVSSRQFSAMRALLRALPSLVLLLPKRRQRGIAKALASGSDLQLPLFGPMRAALDVGPARVTVVVEPREAEGT